MGSEMCSIMDWGLPIIAVGLTTTRGGAHATRTSILLKQDTINSLNYGLW